MKILSDALLTGALVLSPGVFAGDYGSDSSSSMSSSAAQVPELDIGAAGIGFGLAIALTALFRERDSQN